MRSGRDVEISAHFIGSIVCVAEDQGLVATWSPWLVIDGQQRLTTITLILAALATRSDTELARLPDDITPEMIQDLYLLNRHGKGDRRYKLVPAESDKETLLSLITQKDLPESPSRHLLLALYRDYDQGILPVEDYRQAVRLIESYVFRRAVCSIPTHSLRHTFAAFPSAVDTERHLASIQVHFRQLPSYRRFPSDMEFRGHFEHRDMYGIHSGSYWLRKIENHNRPKEPIPVDEYTVEHIMPRTLSQRWKDVLGPEWEEMHETLLHSCGNLTLTGYNSEYSNLTFAEKRDMEDVGLGCSPLRLNQGLAQKAVWDASTIQARARSLSASALQVWPDIERHEVADDTDTTEYRRHRSGATELLDALRSSVLSLDRCVDEEMLPTRIEYRAEDLFASLEQLERGVRVLLHLPLPELRDSRGSAVVATSHGGEGEVEVTCTDINELSYVMGLVSQAYSWQGGLDDRM